jgi:hypothetical protein
VCVTNACDNMLNSRYEQFGKSRGSLRKTYKRISRGTIRRRSHIRRLQSGKEIIVKECDVVKGRPTKHRFGPYGK